MSGETKIKCPYCQKVFLWKKKPIAAETGAITIKCPYCKEELILKKEMLQG